MDDDEKKCPPVGCPPKRDEDKSLLNALWFKVVMSLLFLGFAVPILAYLFFVFYVKFLADVPIALHNQYKLMIWFSCTFPFSLFAPTGRINEGSCEYNFLANQFAGGRDQEGQEQYKALIMEDHMAAVRAGRDWPEVFAPTKWCMSEPAKDIDPPLTLDTDHFVYGKLEPSLWTRAQEVSESAPVFVYYHGGGYCFGTAQFLSYFGCHLSRKLKMRVLMAQYPLVPEVQYPGQLHNTWEQWRNIRNSLPSDTKVFISGDSAGASIAINIMMNAVAENKALLPLGAVLLHPAGVDMNIERLEPYLTTNAMRDPFSNAMQIRHLMKKVYTTEAYEALTAVPMGAEPGSFHGFPPIFISTGEADMCNSAIHWLRDRLKEDGIDVTYRERQGMGHIYHYWMGFFPEADDEVGNHIAKWFKSKNLV